MKLLLEFQCQEVNGIKKLIECGSCTINDSTKRNFSVSELELAAVEMALRKMRLMTVANQNIIIKTDHLPLIGIMMTTMGGVTIAKMTIGVSLKKFRI